MAAALSNGSAQLEAERQRLAEALTLAERDRQLLGYEIHDSIIQDLTAAAMLLEGGGRQASFPSAEAQESYAGGLRLLRESISEARQLIRGLTTLEQTGGTLAKSLSRLVEKFRADHSLPVTFECAADGIQAPASVQHLLLRISQESLFNIWKHAQASRVQVRLIQRGDELELSISDDGVGFDPSKIPPGHFGLEGMRARAAILGATLQVNSKSGEGTRITVQVTVPPL